MTVTPQLTHPSVVIRTARDADVPALARLAALDSSSRLTGPILVAEVEGRILAALATQSGRRIADPFAPTATLLDLLELRALPPRKPRRRVAWLAARTRVA